MVSKQDSHSSCEVVVLDGEPRPLAECRVEDTADANGVSEVAGVSVIKSNPISAHIRTTEAMRSGNHFNYVHITSGDQLYILEDAFVTERRQDVGDLFGDMHLTADKMSVRTLTTRLK